MGLVFFTGRWYSLLGGGEAGVKRRVLLIAPAGLNLEGVGEECSAISIEIKSISEVPSVVEDAYSLAQVGARILNAVKALSKLYDAIVVSCFEIDPPRKLGVPVIGLGDASIISGSLHGRKFTILAPNQYLAELLHRRVLEKGLAPSLASVRVVKPVGCDLFSALLIESRKAIEEDGARAIVLGYPAWRKFSEALGEKLGVPIIEPLSTAIRLLETILRGKGREYA